MDQTRLNFLKKNNKKYFCKFFKIKYTCYNFNKPPISTFFNNNLNGLKLNNFKKKHKSNLKVSNIYSEKKLINIFYF